MFGRLLLHRLLIADGSQIHTEQARALVCVRARAQTLTDVVVLVSRPELEAQGEGREELELLREAQGPVGTAGAVALPALEASHPVLAGGVALVVDHEQDVALHAAVGWRPLVVGTVNVQVVVDVHRHPVLSMPEPGRHRRTSHQHTYGEDSDASSTAPSVLDVFVHREPFGLLSDWCRSEVRDPAEAWPLAQGHFSKRLLSHDRPLPNSTRGVLPRRFTTRGGRENR